MTIYLIGYKSGVHFRIKKIETYFMSYIDLYIMHINNILLCIKVDKLGQSPQHNTMIISIRGITRMKEFKDGILKSNMIDHEIPDILRNKLFGSVMLGLG